MRNFVVGSLLATALTAVGCGGSLEQEESPDLASQQAALPDCQSSGDDLRNYYSDASMTNLVGQFGCHCGGLYWWGVSSQHLDHLLAC
ncbi:hypothetical protein ACN469_39000 [Corallococcus terminator]